MLLFDSKSYFYSDGVVEFTRPLVSPTLVQVTKEKDFYNLIVKYNTPIYLF